MDELTGVINVYPWFGGARKELCARMAKVGGSEWGEAQYSDAAMYVASRTLIWDIMRATRKGDYSDKDVERLIKEYIRPEKSLRQAEALRQAQGPSTSVAGPSTSAAGPSTSAAGSSSSISELSSSAAGLSTSVSELSSSVAGLSSSVAEPVEAPEAPQSNSQPNPVPYHRTVRVAGGDFFSPEQYAAVKKDEDNVFSRFRSERYDDPEGHRWEDPEFGFCTETLAAIYADQGYFAEAKKIYSRLILRYPEKSAYFASLIEKLQQEN